jgi:elongation factor 1-beta
LGAVIVTFKVMPSDVGTDLDDLEAKIRQAISPQRIVREPIAFGLVALNTTKLVDEKEGELDRIENLLKSIEGVAGVEVTEMSRSL